jgi:phosphoglycolate phosphatase-like HAD superfamily hydrolase
VATNKLLLPTRRILEKLEILARFSDCVGPDAVSYEKKVAKREMISYLAAKWRMRADETCVVGDSAADVQAARDNGLISVAILSGYGDAEEIRRSRPAYMVENLRELQALLVVPARQTTGGGDEGD